MVTATLITFKIFFIIRLGDNGGQAICRALLKNRTLTELDVGSNDLGEPTAALLAQVSRCVFLLSLVEIIIIISI